MVQIDYDPTDERLQGGIGDMGSSQSGRVEVVHARYRVSSDVHLALKIRAYARAR